jgi:protein-S-isoprenylcysteine O-methyltransferase Ste14
MISIGNFFFKYRNLVFPIFATTIFIPSPQLFSQSIFGTNYFWIPLISGIVIAISGQVIRAATIGLKYIVRGGKNKKVYAEDLVTQGLFNHCRNPLYMGNILMLAGVGVISNSLIFMVIVVPFFCLIYQAIVLAEENYLSNKFGSTYDEYCKRTNRWVPRLTGLRETFESMKFDWKRYVVSEYNTVYLLFVGLLISVIVFTPPLAQLDNNSKLRMGITVFLVLSAIYLSVRYLKKSKRLERKVA